MRRLAICLVATLVFAGCQGPADGPPGDGDGTPTRQPLDVAILGTAASDFSKVLCDGGCLRKLTTLTEGPANEVHLAIDAANPRHLLAGSKDYHADDPACVVVSVYGSTDGGRTWHAGYPRGRTGVIGGPSKDRCESDPVAAFDGRGNALMITLTLSQGLWTYRTEDVGKSWKEVAMAFKGRNDKNWAATDWGTGRIYSITRYTCDNGQAVTFTDDAGDTWEGPFCFKGMDFAQIDVAANGTVYAVGRTENGIGFSHSADGRNWSAVRDIAEAPGGLMGTHRYRTPALPDMAVALKTGAIYVTWHENAPNDDVFFTASFDGGDTWLPKVKVADDPHPMGSDQFIPAVAASPNGDAHVVFFDARNDPTGQGHLLDVYYAHSADGRTFGRNLRLTPDSFVPYLSRHQSEPFFIGDYVGLVATNGEAVAVFPATNQGRAEIQAAIVGGAPR